MSDKAMKVKQQFDEYGKKIRSVKWLIYPILFVATFIVSAIPYGFNLEKILTASFFGSVCLKFVVELFWTWLGDKDGKQVGEKKDIHIEAVKKHTQCNDLILDKGISNDFELFIEIDFIKQRDKFIQDVLRANSINRDYYEMDFNELMNLYTNQQKEMKAERKMAKKGIYKRLEASKIKERINLTKDQLNVLKRLKYGNFKFDKVSFNTIMGGSQVSNSYQAMNTDYVKQGYKQLFYRLIAFLLTTILMGGMEFGSVSNWLIAIMTGILSIGLAVSAYYVAMRVGISVIENIDGQLGIKDNYIHSFIEQYNNGEFVKDLAIYTLDEVETTENK